MQNDQERDSKFKQHLAMTTCFKEVEDKKRRNEVRSILPSSNSSSPLSWYIPSDPPPSRCQSLNSETSNKTSRQNSSESEYPEHSSSIQVTACRSSQQSTQFQSTPFSTGKSHGSNHYKQGLSQDFGQIYPSRQQSLESEILSNHSRGIQTGSSLLQMYLRKVKVESAILSNLAWILILDR